MILFFILILRLINHTLYTPTMSESDYQTPPSAPPTPMETDGATTSSPPTGPPNIHSSKPTLPDMPTTPIRTRFDVEMADPNSGQGTPTPRPSRRARREVCHRS